MQNNFFVNKRTLKEGQTHIDLLNGNDKDLFEYGIFKLLYK